MILSAILDLFFTISDWFVSALPSISLPINLSGYIQPVANAIGYIDTFVSLPAILLCITAVLIVDNWTIIVRLLLKIWELLPMN